MTKQAEENQLAEMELELEKREFINDVSLVSAILGVEATFKLQMDPEDGSLNPYMKLVRNGRETNEKIEEYLKMFEEQRVGFKTMLGYKITGIEHRKMANQYVTEELKNKEDWESAFMEVLAKIEEEHQYTMTPIIIGTYKKISAGYDVIKIPEKPAENIPTPEPEKQEEPVV